MQKLKYNTIYSGSDVSTLKPEQKNLWQLNKATYDAENLRTGLKYLETGENPNNSKNFPTVAVEKKKHDRDIFTITLSL